MYSLHLTHPKWTHTRSSGQPCYSARGAVGGSVSRSRTPQSWYWRRILPPPTIPAGPEIRTHNFPLISPTRYPLGHDCPLCINIYIYIYSYVQWRIHCTVYWGMFSCCCCFSLCLLLLWLLSLFSLWQVDDCPFQLHLLPSWERSSIKAKQNFSPEHVLCPALPSSICWSLFDVLYGCNLH